MTYNKLQVLHKWIWISGDILVICIFCWLQVSVKISPLQHLTGYSVADIRKPSKRVQWPCKVIQTFNYAYDWKKKKVCTQYKRVTQEAGKEQITYMCIVPDSTFRAEPQPGNPTAHKLLKSSWRQRNRHYSYLQVYFHLCKWYTHTHEDMYFNPCS